MPAGAEFETTERKAYAGDVQAQVDLGLYYLEGNAVEKDYGACIYWLRKAAIEEHPGAQCSLGYRYLFGEGVKKDLPHAFSWFLKSADQKYAEGLLNVGTCYFYGDGVEQDDKKAFEYFKRAVEAEKKPSATAKYYYGRCLVEGIGVEKNVLPGKVYIKEAAAAGHEISQKMLSKVNTFGGIPRGSRRTLSQALFELNSLTGLGKVKHQLNRLINRMKMRQTRAELGLPTEELGVHFIFTGNPGTGKTTVARILGDILKGIGLLEIGHVVETSQGDLIGEYVGSTAPKVQAKINEAMGGILFIDEAYSIARHKTKSGNDFGGDALVTLLKAMEDNRGRFIVVAAGYKKEMEGFLKVNPGLRSRFTNIVEFEDFDVAELIQVFARFCYESDYRLAEKAECRVRELVEIALSRDPENFGNGRFMRNIFDETLMNMANRVAQIQNPERRELIYILAEDIPSIDDINIEGEPEKFGFI